MFIIFKIENGVTEQVYQGPTLDVQFLANHAPARVSREDIRHWIDNAEHGTTLRIGTITVIKFDIHGAPDVRGIAGISRAGHSTPN